jgi:hypothetical protein
MTRKILWLEAVATIKVPLTEPLTFVTDVTTQSRFLTVESGAERCQRVVLEFDIGLPEFLWPHVGANVAIWLEALLEHLVSQGAIGPPLVVTML